MTILEKLKQDRPELSDFELGFTVGTQCPSELGYCEADSWHCNFTLDCCKECWNQPYVEPKPKTVNALSPKQLKEALEKTAKDELGIKSPSEAFGVTAEPTIKDSGDRTEFSTGAVRDMREGKGRCDLAPLGVTAKIVQSPTLDLIYAFQKTRDTKYLYFALERFAVNCYTTDENSDTITSTSCTMLLEVAKHFEEGAKKYGESNWQKGIPVHCYIDSAVRHYLKWKRGDKDEPHDRAFVWNLMCCIWEADYHEYDEVEEES